LFDSLRIRSKLAFALLIPLLALVASSSLVISAANRRADDARAKADTTSEQVALATAALGPSGILTALGDERSAAAVTLIGLDPQVMGGFAAEADLRAAADRASAELRSAVSAKPLAVRTTYQPALDALSNLATIRARTDASATRTMDNPDATPIYDSYTAISDALYDANTRAALAVDDAELRAGVRFIDRLTRYKDLSSITKKVIGSAYTTGHAEYLAQAPAALADAAGLDRLDTELQSDLEMIEHPYYSALSRTVFATPAVNRNKASQVAVIRGERISIDVLLAPDATEALKAINEVLGQAASHLQADADRIRNAAQNEAVDAANQARLVVFVTSIVLILAVLVTLVASRSITRPLARLVRAAENMATNALPAAVKRILDAPLGEDVQVPDLARIDKRGGYEIAEVATALNTVQSSATDLAVEQAVLRRNINDAFVNLGRRNQNLLTRLLDSITEMESNEGDPDQLEQLFALDHVATRMRRNAESLVVLAGVETRRQWSEPLPVIDLVRGSLGEVEDYQRVDIVDLGAAMIDGSAIAESTHLIAELLENALTHSPPGQQVEIRGRAHHGGYRLAIVDHGVGMDPDELAVANRRLSGGESFTVAPSRYLGHYVVGRQASRLGLSVVLRDTPGGGTTAEIELSAVISAPPAPPEPPRSTVSARFAHRSLSSAPVADEAPQDGAAPSPDAGIVDRPATLAEALGQEAAPSPGPGPVQEGAPAADAEPAAVTGPVAASGSATPAPSTTSSGYARRVRGTHAPNTQVKAARTGGPARQGTGGADAMRSALNSMQAGLQRSTAESDDDGGEGTEQR
jgi:signal transduction histidine kinase